uniref:Putative GDSL-like lipase/acylhydrolase n=1 Tax=viral metagenome TaxID=1070528 RepID=A0A6M3LDD8_9ZZZZ
MIHCIGDSHVNLFSGADTMLPKYPRATGIAHENFRSYRLSSRAAYNLGADTKSQKRIAEIIEKHVAKTDWLLFCYGEIDCRRHLPKYLDVQKCIGAYIDTVKMFQQTHGKIILLGPHLTLEHSTTKGYGTYQSRQKVTQEYNEALKLACESSGFVFAAAYYDLLLPDGLPDERYFALYTERDIHLSQRAFPIVEQRIMEAIANVELS